MDNDATARKDAGALETPPPLTTERLTRRQVRYLENRIGGLNKFRAAKAAGYSDAVALSVRSKLEASPAVRRRLEEFGVSNLTSKQERYIEARIAGQRPRRAARTAGYVRDGGRTERSSAIRAALMERRKRHGD